jgi:hypothetical protein
VREIYSMRILLAGQNPLPGAVTVLGIYENLLAGLIPPPGAVTMRGIFENSSC